MHKQLNPDELIQVYDEIYDPIAESWLIISPQSKWGWIAGRTPHQIGWMARRYIGVDLDPVELCQSPACVGRKKDAGKPCYWCGQ